jgi:AcrR family transcriptional regulator
VSSKEKWLSSGLDLLGRAGPGGLTIERLVDAAGLSTGSFYYHFAGVPGFKVALLEYFEELHTTRYIAEVEATSGTGRERLEQLMNVVLTSEEGWDVEVAVRAWALDDEQARAAKERVDRVRIDYLRELWLELSGDAVAADRMAKVLYLLLLGAGHILPPVPPAELAVLYRTVIDAADPR